MIQFLFLSILLQCILKEGVLQRTKITENGKRLRKNWSSSYVVLSELFLLFFKDAKTFSSMVNIIRFFSQIKNNYRSKFILFIDYFIIFGKQKSGQSTAAKPDISIDLNGATIEDGDKASSRKNVYLIGTILGLQVLIQSDSIVSAGEWYKEINNVIKNLVKKKQNIIQLTILSNPSSFFFFFQPKQKFFFQ